MTREIILVCDFIFGSICTALLMDTVDVELMIQMVKGIYTYRKDHTAKSTVFSPWSRTVITFPSLQRKIKHFRMKTDRQQHGTMTMPHFTFLSLPSPNVNTPQERPEPGGLTEDIGLTL